MDAVLIDELYPRLQWRSAKLGNKTGEIYKKILERTFTASYKMFKILARTTLFTFICLNLVLL